MRFPWEFIVGLVSVAGIACYANWQTALGVFVLMWMNNLAHS